jgi:hypothetical protein
MKLRSRGRFNLKRWSRIAADRMLGTAFDRTLRDAKRAGSSTFVFAWNRGLGDIALGLVPLFARIREADRESCIEVVTRDDLAEAFALTDVDAIHVVPGMVRGTPVDVTSAMRLAGASLSPAAIVFADPDPTRWLDGRRQAYPPSLRWRAEWNAQADEALPPYPGDIVIGAHVSSETAQHYGYVKDWPAAAWQALFARFPASRNVRWILFGNARSHPFAQDNVVDLRGQTSFLALLALIRNRCRILVAPDSGVLTAAYYLADDYPLDVISLWSDPRQGILKQGCPSPNQKLRHVALRGHAEDVRNIAVNEVAEAVTQALDSLSAHAPLAADHAPAH